MGLRSSIAAAELLAGPLALAVGAGACIAVALGDYFLGDQVASLVFTEDPEEVKRLIEGKHETFEKEVRKKAYNMFGLTEHCTDEELREAYR